MNNDFYCQGMTPAMQSLVSEIGRSAPGLHEIWLIGSQANGTATPASDWDFIAFGTTETLAYIRDARHLHVPNVDFLVVEGADIFVSAWGEMDKSGSLSGWEWGRTVERTAQYTQSKWIDREDGAGVQLSRKSAIKVWPG